MIKRRQLNTPSWRSKPPQSFFKLHSFLSSSRSLSLFFLLLSLSLPHSLFEEVRLALFLSSFLLLLQTSRKCLEYHRRRKLRCRCASVGGAAEPSAVIDSRAGQPRSRTRFFCCRPVSCCWSNFASSSSSVLSFIFLSPQKSFQFVTMRV